MYGFASRDQSCFEKGVKRDGTDLAPRHGGSPRAPPGTCGLRTAQRLIYKQAHGYEQLEADTGRSKNETDRQTKQVKDPRAPPPREGARKVVRT